MSSHKVIKVWVDTEVCLAHYLCVGESPKVFEQKENVWSVQIKPSADSQVLHAESDNLLWAAAICPVRAIQLTLEDGGVVDGDSELVKIFTKSRSRA